MFSEAFSRDSQLICADPRNSTCVRRVSVLLTFGSRFHNYMHLRRYLACALIVRGDVDISDVRRNIDKYVEINGGVG